MPLELGLGHSLEYAIYWCPLDFVAKLLLEGANPNYGDHAGVPALIGALSTQRSDRAQGRGHYESVLEMAEAAGLEDACELLREATDPTPAKQRRGR
jgi:hypothetical protein